MHLELILHHNTLDATSGTGSSTPRAPGPDDEQRTSGQWVLIAWLTKRLGYPGTWCLWLDRYKEALLIDGNGNLDTVLTYEIRDAYVRRQTTIEIARTNNRTDCVCIRDFQKEYNVWLETEDPRYIANDPEGADVKLRRRKQAAKDNKALNRQQSIFPPP